MLKRVSAVLIGAVMGGSVLVGALPSAASSAPATPVAPAAKSYCSGFYSQSGQAATNIVDQYTTSCSSAARAYRARVECPGPFGTFAAYGAWVTSGPSTATCPAFFPAVRGTGTRETS